MRVKILMVFVALIMSAGIMMSCTGNPVIFNTGGYQLSEENLKWGKFDVRFIELSSIYSYMVYDANGEFFMADGYIYFIDPYLSRMRPDGSDRQVLPDEVKNFWLYEATYSDGWIYFIDNRYDYIDTVPPPGTNENLFRMRSDGTELEECAKNVAYFKIVDDWIIYQSGWSLMAVKIDEWDNRVTISSAVSWNISSWIIHENHIYFSTQKTFGGAGQYNSKMYRADLSGDNTVLLEDDVGTPFTPLFVHDGYLYYKAYNLNNGNIIYRMDLDGENINAVINPERYVLLDKMRFIDGWLHYVYSWIDKDNSYQTVSTIRKVLPEGTEDQEVSDWADWFTGKRFGEVAVWITYEWLPLNSPTKVTVQRIFAAGANNPQDSTLLYNGEGWVSCQHFYAWNGNLYIIINDWRNNNDT